MSIIVYTHVLKFLISPRDYDTSNITGLQATSKYMQKREKISDIWSTGEKSLKQ